MVFPFNEVEGFLSHQDRVDLRELSRRCSSVPGWMLEIGSHCGLSALCVLSGSPKQMLTCYDWFEPEKLRVFKANLGRAGVLGRVRWFPGDFRTYIGERTGPLSFAFIDHSHSFEDNKAAFEWIWPNVKEGGILAFHDYGHPDYKEGSRFLDSVSCGLTCVLKRDGLIAFQKQPQQNKKGPLMINWDDWRRSYDSQTYAQHVAFYDEVYKAHPVQRHVNHEAVSNFIRAYAPICKLVEVIELGGWDGELALNMLENYPRIDSWMNYEICRGAVAASKPHPRYAGLHPNDWVWNIAIPRADLLVAAHVIEHMRLDNVKALIAKVRNAGVTACYVECPISAEPTDWTGYNGSHILEVGWNGLDEVFAKHGYSPAMVSDSIKTYNL